MSLFVAIKPCGVQQVILRFRFVVVLRFPVVVLDKWFLYWCPRFLVSIPVRFVIPKVSSLCVEGADLLL